MRPSVLWLNLALQNCRPATPLVVRLIANKNLAHGTGVGVDSALKSWEPSSATALTRAPVYKRPYLKSGVSESITAWRFYATIGGGLEIHAPPLSPLMEACSRVFGLFQTEFQYTHRARARAYCIRIVLWVLFETSEIRQQECGPLKCQRKVVRHDDAHCSRNHANQATFTLRNTKSRWSAHVAHHRHFAYLDDHG